MRMRILDAWPLLVLLGLLPAAVQAAESKMKTFGRAELELTACEWKGDEIVLGQWFEQGDGATIAMEAEDAFHLAAPPPLEDAQCSGGRCVVAVDRAEFFLHITRPGRYVRWSRAFFPQGGGWIHHESMDDGPAVQALDCDGSNAGAWVWVKGPAYDLKPGLHRLWIHSWHGGAKLDKVLLSAENGYAPRDLGPAAVRRSQAGEGYVQTSSIAVVGLAAAPEIALNTSGDRKGVSAEYRLNDEPFRPAPIEGAIATVEARPGAISFIQLRVALKDRSTSLREISLRYAQDLSSLATLHNDEIQLQISKTSGAVVALRSLATGIEFIAAPSDVPPFRLRHRLPADGKVEDLSLDGCRLTDLRVSEDSRELKARYALPSDISVEVTARLDGWRVEWKAAIANRSSFDIVEVVFPVVCGVRVGEDPEDDSLIQPNWQGGIETAGACRHGGHVPYPTGGAMAWMDLYQRAGAEPAAGFYFASNDQTLMGTSLRAAPCRGNTALDFSITRLAHVRPGETWETPTSVTGLHAGDWHVAADEYRAWAQSWMEKPNPPEWVREVDGWYGLAVSADSNHIPFRRLPEFVDRMREAGFDYIQVWGQMTGGTNCDSLPYPNPVLGDIESFKAAIREVQRWGGHITFYVSSQFWKVDYGDKDVLGSTPRRMIPAGVPIWDWNEWKQYAIRAYDGAFSGDSKLSEEDQKRYGTPWRRTVPCPFTEAWSKRHLSYWCVDQYGFAYGANGIYLDETSAAAERYCFADNHGHKHHGVWGASLAAAIREMIGRGRTRDPNFTFAMEGCSDAIGQFAHMHLISPASAREAGIWGKDRRFAPEIFHYTFPDYILFDGFANGTHGKVSKEDVVLSVHLQGNRYDVFNASYRPYVMLRKKTKQFLYRARFMDNVGVRVSSEAVKAKANLLKDEKAALRLINIINPTQQKDVTVSVDCADIDGVRSVCVCDIDGGAGPIPFTVEGTAARFTAPTARASTVVLVHHAEPLVHAPLVETCAGDAAEVAVEVANVAADPISATVRVQIASGLTATPETAPVQLAAGEMKRVVFSVPTSSAEARCHAGQVVVVAQGQDVRRPLSIVVREPLQVAGTVGSDRLSLAIRNLSRQAISGRLEARSAALSLTRSDASYQIAPQDVTSVVLPRTEGAIQQPVEVEVVLNWPGGKSTQTIVVRPLLLNGGFEELGADNLPAHWAYQHKECAAADDAVFHDGKRSLRLTGNKDAFVEAHQALPIEPGKTYSVRVFMRRTDGAARSIGPAIVQSRDGKGDIYTRLEPGASGDWQEYRATFTAADDMKRTNIYLYNVNSTATVWYDGVEASEKKTP